MPWTKYLEHVEDFYYKMILIDDRKGTREEPYPERK